MMQIGTNPASWGVWFASDPLQPPWQRYLDEVVEAGYRWIELGTYGYLPTDAAVLRRELGNRGLRVSGTHAFVDLIQPAVSDRTKEELTEIADLLASVDATFLLFVAASYIDPKTGQRMGPAVLDEETSHRFAENACSLAEWVHSIFGLRVALHPHVETAVEYEDQIERFLSQTEQELGLCLDVGHHAYRGGDPVRFVQKHHDRICYMHLKNVNPQVIEKVNRENAFFGKAVSMGVFCEPANGTVDFVDLRNVLRDCEYQGWGIVEQGMYPSPFDRPLPIATRTRAYLEEIGLG